MKQRTCGEDVISKAALESERLQLGAKSRAARGGCGAERGAEGEGVSSDALRVHGSEEAPCGGMRAGRDMRGEEGVPGRGVRAGYFVEHTACGGEAEWGEGVGGEELVPARGGYDTGLE